MALSKHTYFAVTLVAFLLLIATNLQAQELKRIPRLIQEAKSQKGAFPKVDVFENQVTKHSDVKSLKDQPIDGVVLTLKDMSAIDFKSATYKHLEFRIPQENGAYIDLELIRNDKSFANTIIKNQDGEVLDMETGVHYRGIIKGDNESLCAVSFLDSGISGFVSNGSSHKSFSKFMSDVNKAFFGFTLSGAEGFQCGTETNSSITTNATNHSVSTGGLKSLASKCVSVYVEVDYDMYLHFPTSVVAEVFSEFNGSFAIFENQISDGNNILSMIISNMMVWDTNLNNQYYACNVSDSGCCNSTNSLHEEFKSRFDPSKGDIGHLITKKTDGGEANGVYGNDISTWSDENRVCVSGFKGTYAILGGSVGIMSGSEYRLYVITHEMGHLLGSRHTHDCVWNGNYTQIDDCGNILLAQQQQQGVPNSCEPDYSIMCEESVENINIDNNGNVTNCPSLELTGTIMSYCGIFESNCTMTTSMNFHSQVADSIRTTIFSLLPIDDSCEFESCYYVNDNSEPNEQPFGDEDNRAHRIFPDCGPDAANFTYEGSICPSNDVDWYKFITISPGEIKVRLTDISLLDNYRIELYYSNVDEFGNEYLEEIPKFIWQEWIRFTNVDENSRQFFIKVFDNEGDDSGTYTIELDWDCTANSNLTTGSSNTLKSNDETVNITTNPTALCNVGNVQLQVESTHDNFVYLDVTNNYNVLCVGCSSSIPIQNAYPGMTIMAVGADLDECSKLIGTVTIGYSSGLDISITPSTPQVNPGGSVQLSVNGADGASCQWSPTTGLSNANSCNPTASPTSDQTYTVTVDNEGCESNASVIVQVIDDDGGNNNGGCTAPNDDPCDATELDVVIDSEYTQSTNYCATDSDVPNLYCDGTSNGDIWYKFTMPASGDVIILTNAGSITDMGMGVYSGSCSNLTEIGCYQNITNADTGITLTYMPGARIQEDAGTEIYIRLWEFGNNNEGTFGILILDIGIFLENPYPDIVTTIDNVSDNTTNQGQTVNVDFVVTNESPMPRNGAIRINYYISSDEIFDPGDMSVIPYFEYFDDLGGLETKTFNRDITIPSTLADGNYYIIVTTNLSLYGDTFQTQFQEANGNDYSNNYDMVHVTVGDVDPIGVDITISGEEISPDNNIEVGDQLTLTYRVRNRGDVDAPNGGNVAFYLSEDNDYDPDIDLFLDDQSFFAIDSDEYDSETQTLTAPSVPYNGTWYIILVADSDNEILELNEGDDNIEYVTITYAEPQTEFPDYVETDDMQTTQNGIETSNLTTGEPYQVTFRIQNNGDAASSTSSMVRLYIALEGNLNNRTYLDVEQSIPALAMGENAAVVFNVTNADFEGDYVLIAEIDDDDDINEGSGEGNNEVWYPVSFEDVPKPDYVGSNLRVEQGGVETSEVVIGEFFYMHLDVANIGLGNSIEPVSVDFALSGFVFGEAFIEHIEFESINTGTFTTVIGERLLTDLSLVGSYQLIAYIDNQDNINESNEDNNTVSIPINIVQPIDTVGCRQRDSLALIELYESTDGANWTNTWQLEQPIDEWFGITVNDEGCVTCVDLDGYPNCSNLSNNNSGNNLVGNIPDLELYELEYLNLNGNSLNGTIPNFSKLPKLKGLYLRFNELEGSIPNFNNIPELVDLELNDNNLTGAIPDFSNMPNLRELLLYYNELTGNIPDFSNLPNLRFLHLAWNPLSGAIPNFSNLPNLDRIRLISNGLTGELPGFSNVTNLSIIEIQGNNIEGSVPEFTNLSNLEWLILSGNKLDGHVPDFSHLPNLSILRLQNNSLIFEDIITHSLSNELFIEANTPGYYDYAPQSYIGTQQTVTLNAGANYTIDLMVDDTVNSNIYQWYKDGSIYATTTVNELSFNNLQLSDAGVYTCQITNPISPDLTLYSRPITLLTESSDNPCRMSDSLALVALYESTNGIDWTTTWDLSQPIDTWHGITLNDEGCVVEIDIYNNNIIGNIPPEIGNLVNLQNFDLYRNGLTGSIPPEITNLTNLSKIRLGDNDLSGPIPQEIGNMTALKSLSLLRNYSFGGPIPAGLGTLPNITDIWLSDMDLSGEIPSELGNLTKMYLLYLDGNNLTGDIPIELGNLYNLEQLTLDRNNLTGSIPATIGDIDRLIYLDVHNNQLSGCYDPNLLNLTLRSYIDNSYISYGNNFDASWEAFKSNGSGACSSVTFPDCRESDSLALVAFYNSTDGANWREPWDLNQPIHTWEGIDANGYGCVGRIEITYEIIMGIIPPEIGNLSYLTELTLWNNSLAGSIPEEIGNLTNLNKLHLFSCDLEGTIPPQIGNLTKLRYLDLRSNNLSGDIPSQIGNLTELEYLSIGRNDLTGSIPATFGNLTKLEYLGLELNDLSGAIPDELSNLSNLTTLSLHDNNLSGDIYVLENLNNLVDLKLDDNEFSGGIPPGFGSLENLYTLSLHDNQFSGCYPENLSNLCNQLSPYYNNNAAISDGNNFDAPFEDFCNDEAGTCNYIQFDVKAMLEGPYDPTQSQMTTILNTERGLLPGQTPVGIATPTPAGQPYSQPPWNYMGREGANFTDADYSPTVVDMVLVSLRIGTTKSDEVAKVAALLHKDGCIETLENHPLATSHTGPFYVVIEHRNHMGIMSPTPISIDENTIHYDFTTQDSYGNDTGVGQKELALGLWGMFCGDFDQTTDIESYDINGSDKTIWNSGNGIFDAYILPDANLDGDVNGADKIYWEKNNGFSSRVPK